MNNIIGNSERYALPDSNLLLTFVKIAECENLTLAASMLNRSQSAISIQLRKLEDDLNTKLFLRDGKGMRLSPEGKKLLPAARQVLSDLAKLPPLLSKPLKGKIKVGIPDDYDEGVLEKALAEFSRGNPGVEVKAISGCTAVFPDLIGRGDLDIAVYSGPDNTLGSLLLEQRPVWVSGHSLQLRPSDPVPLALIGHGCWMGTLPKQLLEGRNRDFTIAFECSGMMSLKAAIRSGFAVGVLFESNVEADMRVLTPKDGFPPFPLARRSIICSDGAPRDLADAMAQALKSAIGACG